MVTGIRYWPNKQQALKTMATGTNLLLLENANMRYRYRYFFLRNKRSCRKKTFSAEFLYKLINKCPDILNRTPYPVGAWGWGPPRRRRSPRPGHTRWWAGRGDASAAGDCLSGPGKLPARQHGQNLGLVETKMAQFSKASKQCCGSK